MDIWRHERRGRGWKVLYTSYMCVYINTIDSAHAHTCSHTDIHTDRQTDKQRTYATTPVSLLCRVFILNYAFNDHYPTRPHLAQRGAHTVPTPATHKAQTAPPPSGADTFPHSDHLHHTAVNTSALVRFAPDPQHTSNSVLAACALYNQHTSAHVGLHTNTHTCTFTPHPHMHDHLPPHPHTLTHTPPHPHTLTHTPSHHTPSPTHLHTTPSPTHSPSHPEHF